MTDGEEMEEKVLGEGGCSSPKRVGGCSPMKRKNYGFLLGFRVFLCVYGFLLSPFFGSNQLYL